MKLVSIPGVSAYEEIRKLQLELVEKRARDEIEDTILFLEHEPVITQGQGLQWTGKPRERHMPVPIVLPQGISFSESERGGDLTYHGPGQLVIYPILKMRDISAHIRLLETALIDLLAEFGFEGSSKKGATGVWVNGKKVASVGIAVRKWVSYHGMAINVVNDLKPFHLISPCGFSPDIMTSLKELGLVLPLGALETPESWGSVRSWLEERIFENLCRISLRMKSISTSPPLPL